MKYLSCFKEQCQMNIDSPIRCFFDDQKLTLQVLWLRYICLLSPKPKPSSFQHFFLFHCFHSFKLVRFYFSSFGFLSLLRWFHRLFLNALSCSFIFFYLFWFFCFFSILFFVCLFVRQQCGLTSITALFSKVILPIKQRTTSCIMKENFLFFFVYFFSFFVFCFIVRQCIELLLHRLFLNSIVQSRFPNETRNYQLHNLHQMSLLQ